MKNYIFFYQSDFPFSDPHLTELFLTVATTIPTGPIPMGPIFGMRSYYVGISLSFWLSSLSPYIPSTCCQPSPLAFNLASENS